MLSSLEPWLVIAALAMLGLVYLWWHRQPKEKKDSIIAAAIPNQLRRLGLFDRRSRSTSFSRRMKWK